MSEYQQEEARKRAQSCYCQSLFRKDTTDFKPGVLAPEVYQFDEAHSLEESLDMRLEALAGLNDRDYPCIVPVRACVESLVRNGTKEEKTLFLMQEKQILQSKVSDFQKKCPIEHYYVDRPRKIESGR
ncbi:hypothetical protein [Listeria fleischmannii]|uniref:Uncharacterized protein n=1 Tax=Listeria fleischmannii FSL S10-1203 TaxID=1265822 RepID=W7D643_9LIST|nr:hypothetical protein [Listeria fleischmannii]EUJ44692.1 hypothetical protein MCOL2_19731 [Listeria fleischmannii FSL S10-1203]